MPQEQLPRERTKEEKLADFIAEFALIQDEEKHGIRATRNFSVTMENEDYFDPKELTQEDMAIWEKAKDGSIAREDVDRYQKATMAADLNASRKLFRAFILAKADNVFMKHTDDADPDNQYHNHQAS